VVAAEVEEVADLLVGGEEALCLSGCGAAISRRPDARSVRRGAAATEAAG
jgi:hypothetical protein